MLNVDTDNHVSDNFRDIFKRSMHRRSGSRPPKMELTGILMPCLQNVGGRVFSYKLGADSGDYYLAMSSELAIVAKGAQWEEVTVKGFLDLDTNIFEVERLIVTEPEEAFQVPPTLKEPFDIDVYTRTIGQLGKLEPEAGFLAS